MRTIGQNIRYYRNDLKTLVSMGCVSVDQNRVKFINWP